MKDVISIQDASAHAHHPSLAHINRLIKKALLARNKNKFFKNLCLVIDYIETEPHFSNLCWKWRKDQEESNFRIHSLELKVYTKSKMAYETLKSRIRDNQIIEPEINEKIKELDGQFTGQEECCPPFPWRLAYDGVKELGSLLEKIKRFDLLEGFAILQNRVISSLSPNGDICEIIEEPFVELLTFTDEIIELIDLQENRSRKIITHSAIWEQLMIARWCYNTPFSYWTRKKLRYDTRHYRKESWERLNLHALWCEMYAIKKNSNKSPKLFFGLKNFKGYLKELSEMITKYIKKYSSIVTHHLYLDGDCLWVIYRNKNDNKFYPFMIKQLKENLDLHCFVTKLMQEGHAHLDIPKTYSVSSLLDHLNMPVKSHLASLFFNGWCATQICFKGKTVSGEEIESQIYVPDLLKELRSLHKGYQSKDHIKFPPETFLVSISK